MVGVLLTIDVGVLVAWSDSAASGGFVTERPQRRANGDRQPRQDQRSLLCRADALELTGAYQIDGKAADNDGRAANNKEDAQLPFGNHSGQ